MSCDDFVEYMTFECGMQVRVTWGADRVPTVKYLNRLFDRADNLHGEICLYCKESDNVGHDPT
jgi:hypothetical protein